MNRGKVTMAAVIFLFIFLLVGCGKPSRIRRVVVSYPEHWNDRESRNCVLAGDDPVSKLPHLNCDLPATGKLAPQCGNGTGDCVKFTNRAQIYADIETLRFRVTRRNTQIPQDLHGGPFGP